jgi:hypothetical protein
METIMSQTMQNPGARPELTEDHRPLADSELDAVSGGFFRGGYVMPMPTAKTHSQIEDPHQFGGWITETER